MYESFYGLKEKPFRIVPNPEYLYLSPKHQSALTYLEYGLMEDVGFILLTGDVGTGKTTLVRHIVNQMDAQIEAAVIFNTNVSSEQLLGLILQSFELSLEVNDKAKTLRRLYRFLIEKYGESKRVLLIIDEAQNLSDESMEEVRMLSNLQSDEHILLQIMLVGQPELKDRLKQPRCAPITQRIAVYFHLSALNHQEARTYIAFRLRKAGGNPEIFDAKAVELIYRASGGIPRSINLLCDAALVYGFGYEMKTIGVPVVKQVLRDRCGLALQLGNGKKVQSGSTHSGNGTQREVLARIQALEKGLGKLKMEVAWQSEKLEGRADKFKDDMVEKLRSLFVQERKKNDLLLARYTLIKDKYMALQKKQTQSPASQTKAKSRTWFKSESDRKG